MNVTEVCQENCNLSPKHVHCRLMVNKMETTTTATAYYYLGNSIDWW